MPANEIQHIDNADNLKKLIYEVRGVKVMLDADLATIYGYTTKAFNQQVKNNIQKFDEDFRFQLAKEEYKTILMSRNLTSKIDKHNSLSDNSDESIILRSKKLTLELQQGKYSKYLPYAFTEQGIYMLMTVLKGDLATKQSKALIRTFKEMKDFIVDNQTLIGNRELLHIAVQTSQNTAEIAVIKDKMVTKTELVKVIHDFTDHQIPSEYLILNGKPVEADIAYNTIYKKAQHSIYVIDNYIGLKTLVLLKDISHSIPVTLFTDNKNHGLHKKEYADFCIQYPQINISFRKANGIIHDRYIILDYGTATEKIYHCGASSKDAGKKVNTITEVKDRNVYHPIVDALLNNPTLTI